VLNPRAKSLITPAGLWLEHRTGSAKVQTGTSEKSPFACTKTKFVCTKTTSDMETKSA
jgi:hypothetical protein